MTYLLLTAAIMLPIGYLVRRVVYAYHANVDVLKEGE